MVSAVGERRTYSLFCAENSLENKAHHPIFSFFHTAEETDKLSKKYQYFYD
jgi:hypothetical protein